MIKIGKHLHKAYVCCNDCDDIAIQRDDVLCQAAKSVATLRMAAAKKAKCNNDCNHHQGGRLLCSAKSVPAFGTAAVELRSKRGKPFAIQVKQLLDSALVETPQHKLSIFVNLAFSSSSVVVQAAKRDSRVEARRFTWPLSRHQCLSSSSHPVLSQLQARRR